MQPLVILIVFGVVALAELPDKSLLASLVLGTRYRPLWVFLGAAAAFLVHVSIAVAAGGLLSLLPHRIVEAIVAVLFGAGAAVLLLRRDDADDEPKDRERGGAVRRAPTMRRVVLMAFAVVFLGEWGDITQIVIANYAARYDDPISVGIGATLALWAVAGLAVTAGSKVLSYVPVSVVRRVAGIVLLAFAILSTVNAIG